ncbi:MULTISPECIES: hypothetical protein [Bizionia]|uniref:Selenophosphate synthetase n=1 Tax=Bizionia algoritergicola TaxID=291187 RepID=A0A5D0QUZ0_9FLAO|nr:MULTISPECIES: hypothetical protein [Bizionia]OBX22641.1 hypothetical protein BAA08_07445 [Bizionia sp. APA-3]TYB72932.1 hypothetical protein ES675_10340 [Bizionia algoritergicola]
MKQYILIFSVLLFIQSCKPDKNTESTEAIDEKTLTTSEKIAQAYGVENWDSVNTITFAFNVQKDSTLFKRSWKWSPKTNDITLITANDTIRYNRNQMDSTFVNADKAFINDKFWLLAPFNLVWDSGTTISEPIEEMAPISKKMLNKITTTYSNDGGYTPGDAYDFYYNNNYLIEEWVYRKGNAKEPSMMSTWENNKDFKGVLVSLSHKKTDDNWELFFDDVSID